MASPAYKLPVPSAAAANSPDGARPIERIPLPANLPPVPRAAEKPLQLPQGYHLQTIRPLAPSALERAERNQQDFEADDRDRKLNTSLVNFRLSPAQEEPNLDLLDAMRVQEDRDPGDPFQNPDAEEFPAQSAELIRGCFGRADRLAQMTLKDLEPWRIVVAWRLVREFCRIRKLASPYESLDSALAVSRHEDGQINQENDLWYMPSDQVFYPSQVDRVSQRTVQAIKQAEGLSWDQSYWCWNVVTGEPIYRTGLAVMPPPIPLESMDLAGMRVLTEDDLTTDPPKRGYKLENDRCLSLYLSAMSGIANYLAIENGSIIDPDYGRLGLRGLLEPEHARIAWPNPVQLILWERMLVEYALDLLVKKGGPEAALELNRRYALNRAESAALMRQAKALAVEQTRGDIEEERAIMLMRLDELARRSRMALDLRTELMTLKNMAQIQGLLIAGDESDSKLNDFLDVVGKFKGKESPMLEAPARVLE